MSILLASVLALSPASSFVAPTRADLVIHEQRLDAEIEIVELRGEIEGVPLLHPVVRAAVDVDGAVFAVRPAHVPPLASAVVSLDEADAIAAVERTGISGSTGAAVVRLVAEARTADTRLAWLVEPPVDLSGPTSPIFLVDATTGEVELVGDRVRDGLAHAYFRNPVRDPLPGNYPLLGVNPWTGRLEGPWLAARNCAAVAIGQPCVPMPTAFPDAFGNFLYAPPFGWPAAIPVDTFAEVSAFYHADKFLAWLSSMGYGTLRCHRLGRAATVVANYRTIGARGWAPVENAFWTGDCSATIVLGQGARVDYAYDGDIVAHEVGHGVVEARIGGVMLGRPHHRAEGVLVDAAAINEAVADFLSSVHAGDPAVGEYIAASNGMPGPGMRDNDNALTCPASFVGESHFDSEALAGGLWEAYRVVGGAMVPIVLDAVALLPDDATMEEMTAAVVAVAGIRGGPSTAAIVEEILAERGLDECARIVEPQQLRGPLFVAPTGLHPYTPAAVQLLVPGGARLRFTVGAGEAIVLAKADAPIEFSYAGSQVSSDATLEVEAAGEVQLPAGDHVYVSFANPGADPVLVTSIAAAVDDDKADRIAPEEDAAAEGCRVGARPPTFAGLVLLLLLGACERKRRTSQVDARVRRRRSRSPAPCRPRRRRDPRARRARRRDSRTSTPRP